MIAVTGNTYPVKDALKALGAKWNPDQKAWMVSEDKAAAARALVAKGSSSAESTTYHGPKTCTVWWLQADTRISRSNT